MALQFQHVFAGKGMRIGEKQSDAFIQYGVIDRGERAVMGIAGFRRNTQRRWRDGKRTLTGYANNTHAAATGRSGNSSDGVLMNIHKVKGSELRVQRALRINGNAR